MSVERNWSSNYVSAVGSLETSSLAMGTTKKKPERISNQYKKTDGKSKRRREHAKWFGRISFRYWFRVAIGVCALNDGNGANATFWNVNKLRNAVLCKLLTVDSSFYILLRYYALVCSLSIELLRLNWISLKSQVFSICLSLNWHKKWLAMGHFLCRYDTHISCICYLVYRLW